MSVEWARCEPAEGELDEDAFDRYRAILDACRARGLEPLVTLHHFTHPWWLGEDFWLGLDAPERFAAWAAEAADRLGPSCSQWVTVNEPWVVAILGHAVGRKAPGIRDWPTALTVAHHLLLSHGLAVDALRAQVKAPVGITLNLNPMRPLTDADLRRSGGNGLGRCERRDLHSPRRIRQRAAAGRRAPRRRRG